MNYNLNNRSLPSPTFASTSPPIIALEEESTFQRTTSPTRPPDAAAKVTFQEERPCLSLVWILEAKGKDSLSVMNHTIYVEQDGISRSVRCQWKMVTGKGQAKDSQAVSMTRSVHSSEFRPLWCPDS